MSLPGRAKDHVSHVTSRTPCRPSELSFTADWRSSSGYPPRRRTPQSPGTCCWLDRDGDVCRYHSLRSPGSCCLQSPMAAALGGCSRHCRPGGRYRAGVEEAYVFSATEAEELRNCTGTVERRHLTPTNVDTYVVQDLLKLRLVSLSSPPGTALVRLVSRPMLSATFWLLIVWVYLHSNLCSGLQKTHLFCTRVRFGRSRTFRVIHGRWFWYQSNQKRVCDFLLVGSLWLWSYLAPFLRYGDLLAIIAYFCYIFATPLSFLALA